MGLFLSRHFPKNSFNGRLQLGCHGKHSFALLPVFTCDYASLLESLADFCFYPTVDYYISVNAVSGVARQGASLFSLHNLVVDVDCHEDISSDLRDFLIDCLLLRLKHSFFEFVVPMPSSIVKTGRGLQFWWSITGISGKFKAFYLEVLDFYISALSEVLVEGLLEDFSMFQVDVGASKNVVGYFRLPCTVNTKSNSLVSYEACAGTYELMGLFEQMKLYLAENELAPIVVDGPVSSVFGFPKDYVDLAHERVGMYDKLRELRHASVGLEERNNFCFMVYNAFVPCYGHQFAFCKMEQFNEGFQEPLSKRELNVVISSAKEKGGYHYTTGKIVEFLHISQEEQVLLGMTEKDFASLSKRKKTQIQNFTKKELRNEAVLNLYDAGKTVQSISSEMNLAINTVTKILGEHGRSHKVSRKEQILSLHQEGKSFGEIAEICGCSVKTVRRGLVS